MPSRPLVDEVAGLYRSGSGTAFNPARHAIIDCQYIDALADLLDRRDLGLVRHLIHGTYIIVVWLDPPDDGCGPGYFVEIETLQHHPDHYGRGDHPSNDRPSLTYMALRLQPTDRDPIIEYDAALTRKERHEANIAEDEEREAASLASFYERKGPRYADFVTGLRSGELSYARDNHPLLNDITEQMIDIAKGTERASIRVTHQIGD